MSKINFWSFYKTVWWWEWDKCYYPTRLDTYWQGCSHDCSYCYAKSLLDFRKMRKPHNPKFIDLKKAYKIIAKIPQNQITRLGWMTDCFQPVEKTHEITYNVLKVFNYYKKEYLIVTKSDLVASDKYLDVLDKNLAHIQISITSTEDDIAKKYEKAPLISQRIKAIEKLQKLGYDVQVRLSPFIPEYINYEKLNNIKCDKILIEFLRVNHRIKKRFNIDYSNYTLKEWWYKHLPLTKKKKYLRYIQDFKEETICEDVKKHYNHRQNNYNANENDCCNLKQF